ncbi:MAG: AMP-binding protein, partial [Burkholderiales bacterium]|nr:AMP-binding protein [Anaerolineae bacterium]
MPTVEPQTFYNVLLSQSEKAGDSPALKTLNAPDLSYTNFVHEVQAFMAALIGWGVKRGDKVIIQLPDGPEMFVALCAVSSVATAIPLNRHASAEEVSRILGFVKPKAVVVQSDLETSIRQAAQQNGARLIEITPERERGAGALHFTETPPAASLDQLEIAPEDIALIIHTSGTTGLPKMLEISHQTLYMENLAAVALWQRLAGDELIQVLNVLPMHLLFAIRLACASIMTGGSVVCVPGFNPDQFLGWLAQFQPNNLSATPPFLEQVVEAASRHPEKVAGHSLRYIATSSSPLHESLWAQLEQI